MLSDIKILQKKYPAGVTFRLKNSDTIFFLLKVDWIEYNIEYRRRFNFGWNECFFGSIDDIRMYNNVSIAWRNIKIDNLIDK